MSMLLNFQKFIYLIIITDSCKLPPGWSGSWFESGVRGVIDVNLHSISHKGRWGRLKCKMLITIKICFDKGTGYMPITSLIYHGVIVGSEDYSDEVAVDVDVNMTRYNGDIKQWWWNWKYWQHLLWWLIGNISGAWSSFATATSSFSEAGDQSSDSIWSAIKHLGHFTPSLGITNSHQGSFLPLPIVDWPTWMIFVNRLFLSPALFPHKLTTNNFTLGELSKNYWPFSSFL